MVRAFKQFDQLNTIHGAPASADVIHHGLFLALEGENTSNGLSACLLTLFQGDDNSPASFEKALSTLSAKIAEATSRLDQQRQTSRRFKALWTLYSTFAYIFYSIVLALVLGWETWGIKEYTAIVCGPILYDSFRS